MNLDHQHDMVKTSIPIPRDEVVQMISVSTSSVQMPDVPEIEIVRERLEEELLKDYFLSFQHYPVDPEDSFNRVLALILRLKTEIPNWISRLRANPGITESVYHELSDIFEGSKGLNTIRKI